tara:strand:+ start:60485 stop:60736 length:252 start_codon:yes stop_codon:yes gene_type:complete
MPDNTAPVGKIHSIDAKRLLCPMPVIKLQNLVKHCQPGDQIEIVCTDPGTQQDIPAWCRIHSHDIIAIQETEASHWLFKIAVG